MRMQKCRVVGKRGGWLLRGVLKAPVPFAEARHIRDLV